MIHVDVAIDVQAYEVVLRFGNDATVYRLGWAQAANLASLLNEASKQAEPPAPPGRTYCPTIGRWG